MTELATVVRDEAPTNGNSRIPKGSSVKQVKSQLEAREKAGSVRIQLTLKAEHAEVLDALVTETGASSYSDVMRDAMRVYKWITNETKKGHQVYVREDDGTLVRITLW